MNILLVPNTIQLNNDLGLADINIAFTDLMEHNGLEEIRQIPLPKLVQYLSGSNELENITVLLTRVIAGKANSAHVERLIIENNVVELINR